MRSPGKIMFEATVAVGILAGLTGCGDEAPPTATEIAEQEERAIAKARADELNAMPDSERNCMPDYRRDLPTATNVTQVKDTREGGVYACQYFMDAHIPFNTPVELIQTEERAVTTSSSRIQGNFGGFAILGSGLVSGSFAGSSKSEDYIAVAITFKDSEGARRVATIPQENNLKIMECSDACTPTVTFNLPDTMLWERTDNSYGGDVYDCTGGDDASIWMSRDVVADEDNAQTCTRVVSQIAINAPTDNPAAGEYTGGPASMGQIIKALSEEIILEVPPAIPVQ